MLRHLAIIMDGNSRWAKKNALPSALGHRQGAETLKKILQGVIKLNIKYFTIYSFSSENWQRDEGEVASLLDLLKIYLTNELENLIKNNICVRIIGDKNKFPDNIVELINNLEAKTKNNNGLFLQIALSYGARDEIIMAHKSLLSDLNSAKINSSEINAEKFADYLYTANIPDPDFLIRTGGEYRISNFLLWQIAYTELYFSKILWPDFKVADLRRAVENFYKRERLYGLSR